MKEDQVFYLPPHFLMWAKTNNLEGDHWHPLLLHLLDVAASADAILAREPESTRLRLATSLGLDWEAAPFPAHAGMNHCSLNLMIYRYIRNGLLPNRFFCLAWLLLCRWG